MLGSILPRVLYYNPKWAVLYYDFCLKKLKPRFKFKNARYYITLPCTGNIVHVGKHGVIYYRYIYYSTGIMYNNTNIILRYRMYINIVGGILPIKIRKGNANCVTLSE